MIQDDDVANRGHADSDQSNQKITQGDGAHQTVSTPQQPADNQSNPKRHKKPIWPIRLWRNRRRRLRGIPPANRAERLTVWITLVIALVGAVQAGIYYQQKKIMESSGQQTDKLIAAANIQAGAAQQIANASDRNAAAADRFAASADGIKQQSGLAVAQFQRLANDTEKSLQATQKTFLQDQRAWVGLLRFGCEGCSRGDRFVHVGQVMAIVSNTGKTPAIKMDIDRCYSAVEQSTFRDPFPDVDNIFSNCASQGPLSLMTPKLATQEVLAPNGGFKTIEVIPAIGDVGKTTQGIEMDDYKHRIFGVIRITYNVLGDSERHTTTFCIYNEFGMGAAFELCPSDQSMN